MFLYYFLEILWFITVVPSTSLAESPTFRPTGAPFTEENTWFYPNNPAFCCSQISSVPQGNIIAAAGFDTSDSGVFISQNYGSSWQVSNTGLPVDLDWDAGLVSISSNAQYLVAADEDGGAVYYSNNGGNLWNEADTFPSSSNGVQWRGLGCSSSGQFCVIGGNTGSYLYHSVNYGVTWMESDMFPTPDNYWYQVTFASSTNEVFALQGMVIWKSSNYGYTWSEITNVPYSASGFLYSLAVSSDASVMIVGTYGLSIYYSMNSGGTWNQSVGLPCYMNTFSQCFPAIISIACDNTGQYVTAVSGGSIDGIHYTTGIIFLSNNYGNSFMESTLIPPSNLTFVSVTSNSAGTQVAACLGCLLSDISYDVVIGEINGGVSVDGSSDNNDDQYSSVGGIGGVLGISFALIIVVGGMSGFVLYYYFYISKSPTVPSSINMTNSPQVVTNSVPADTTIVTVTANPITSSNTHPSDIDP
jgi:photosystem II stability/assembly factor-like uncharacterized protein